MNIIITNNSGQPIYDQIASQIKALIISGRSERRHPVLWEKPTEWAFRKVSIFRRNFYDPVILHVLIPRKAPKSVMETSAPRK